MPPSPLESEERLEQVFDGPSSFSRTVFEGFTRAFANRDGHETLYSFDDERGVGSSRGVRVSPFIDLRMNELCLTRDMRMLGRARGEAYVLLLCLGDPTSWQEEVTGVSFELPHDAGMLYRVGNSVETGLFEGGRRYRGLTMTMRPRWFDGHFGEGERKTLLLDARKARGAVAFPLPPAAKIAVAGLAGCDYTGAVRSLYLEGKVLELLCACTHAILGAPRGKEGDVRLSRTDRKSIACVKELIDRHYGQDCAIADLARKACVNQSKLKSGFRLMYGRPIHAYLMDRRLEAARMLLETQGGSVGSVARAVGYSSASGFSKAFRKRYGYPPGEHLRP